MVIHAGLGERVGWDAMGFNRCAGLSGKRPIYFLRGLARSFCLSEGLTGNRAGKGHGRLQGDVVGSLAKARQEEVHHAVLRPTAMQRHLVVCICSLRFLVWSLASVVLHGREELSAGLISF